MLLNEIKRIFEADRDVLAGSLSALNINTNFNVSSNKEPGDIDQEFKPAIQKSIVTFKYVTPSNDEVTKMTSTAEIKNKTLSNLATLIANIDEVDEKFSQNLIQLNEGDKIADIAAAEGRKLSTFINQTKIFAATEKSPLRNTHQTITIKSFSERKLEITNMLMKATSAVMYSNETINELENFLKKKGPNGWFEADGTTISASGITILRGNVERFYIVLAILKENTNNFIGQITRIPATKV